MALRPPHSSSRKREGMRARAHDTTSPLRPAQGRRQCWPAACAGAGFSGGFRSPTQQAMNHPSVDDGEDRVELPDLLVGHLELIEIVLAQHYHIAELAHFDRAQLILFPEEPAVGDGVQADRLLTRNL